jgi:chorismate dehydratase
LTPGSLDRICQEWAPRLGLEEGSVKTYLTENIHYSLDSSCIEGMRLFYHYAEECGALPTAPPLQFLNMVKAVAT